MATTKMEGISTSSHLEHAIGYIQSEKKTEYGRYVSCMNCTPKMAYLEFKMINKKYRKNQEKGKERDKWVAYHVHQNFDPNEKITPELAHEIGVKLAEKLYSDYQCVVTTHIDRLHIHNHIIFNSVAYETGKKFNRCTRNTMLLRKTSDELCKEYNLTILKEYEANTIKDFYRVNEKSKSKKYHDTEVGKKNKYSSWKEIIKEDIEEVVKRSKNFDKFISSMEQMGYEVKYKNVKHIAFKAPGQKKFTRGDTIGDKYSLESIKNQIDLYNIDRKEEVSKKLEKSNHNSISKSQLEVDDIFEFMKEGIRVEESIYKSNFENYTQNIVAYKNKKIQIDDIENMSPKWKKIVTIANEVKYEKRSEIETSLILFLKLLLEEKNKIVINSTNRNMNFHIEKVRKDIEQGIENMNFITENNLKSKEEIEQSRVLLEKELRIAEKGICLLEEKLQEYHKINQVVEKCLQLKNILNDNNEQYEHNLKEEKKILGMAEQYLKEKNMYVLVEKEEIYNNFKTTIKIKIRENEDLKFKLNQTYDKLEKVKNLKNSLKKIDNDRQKIKNKREKNK